MKMVGFGNVLLNNTQQILINMLEKFKKLK